MFLKQEITGLTLSNSTPCLCQSTSVRIYLFIIYLLLFLLSHLKHGCMDMSRSILILVSIHSIFGIYVTKKYHIEGGYDVALTVLHSLGPAYASFLNVFVQIAGVYRWTIHDKYD